MPAEVVVGDPLHFWVDGIVASLTHLFSNNTKKDERKIRSAVTAASLRQKEHLSQMPHEE